METTRPPGFPGNPPARMPRAPTPARSPPPRPLRCGEIAFRPTHDVGPHKQCMSGLNHAAYGLPVNASRPGSPQAHASLGSGWRPTLAGWDWIPTGCRTRFQRSHHGILSPLTGLSRHTHCCMTLARRRGPMVRSLARAQTRTRRSFRRHERDGRGPGAGEGRLRPGVRPVAHSSGPPCLRPTRARLPPVPHGPRRRWRRASGPGLHRATGSALDGLRGAAPRPR